MSSYVCPNCGMGFPRREGSAKVKKTDPSYDDLNRVQKVILLVLIAMGVASTTDTEIHCPGCGYVLIGDSERRHVEVETQREGGQ